MVEQLSPTKSLGDVKVEAAADLRTAKCRDFRAEVCRPAMCGGGVGLAFKVDGV
jgi:hypothetical protein